MKKKLLVILLSLNLLFLGCSSKSTNLDTPSSINTSQSATESANHSVAERVFIGGLVVGMGALILTTAAVVILLLVPKAQIQRR
jgi:starvation-inducible outer membrane lipoprotein